MSSITCLHNPLCELAEGPLWHASEEALYWTDINGKRLWRFVPAKGHTEMIWEGTMKIGGFAFLRNGGFLVCADQGVFIVDRAMKQWERLHGIPEAPDERFNDITTDPRGRVFAGTLKRSCTDGTLYRLERGKEPVAVLRNVGISNGMTFSLDEKTFFHTDSRAKQITAFDYDADSGGIGNPRPFYQAAEGDGSPDGITIDREGFIWAACWGASRVVRIDPHGAIAERISVPAKQPSSVIFGGREMNILFITTAHEGSADPVRGLDGNARFLGGHIYYTETTTCGRPEWEADFGPAAG